MRALPIVFVAVIFSALPALADNFRCPNGNIVSTGDAISTVAAKCDPPAGTFRREEPVEMDRRGGRAGIVYIEVQEWTYDQGSTLLHTLVFRNGMLSEVRTGGFVK
ncbi:DUF2845 domain-containing protein [Geobacter sp. SVR]|uniref:DUF2845 domain-containing protein n=1 Tax=Geobacter sp. SVR TaxID=2495594 RepID=UPI00143EF54E|nr:DUF2845 domain-containing protein [Geobacter sp. SVR]BCS52055.1 hypothetical protein GSVR_03630 [Geobacter sp. SVR]GCF86510.1 hypothetical protein GSbR_31100 [Geobacter sp. SVR]